MKFVHAADLHIDSALRGLSEYDGAPCAELRGASRKAFRNLIELCNREEAALLLLVGDLFDTGWRDRSSGVFFATELTRLKSTRVLIVRGNHDAQDTVTAGVRLPSFVTVLSENAPEHVILEEVGVVVHGQSFKTKREKRDLAKHYPKAIAGYFNIGMLHTSLAGGERDGHENYAPTDLETLRSKGYDYWALGHIHKREVVCETPYVLYPGNIQGRHAKEIGAKGATVVTVHNARIVEVEAVALDVARWYQPRVEIGLHDEENQVVDAVGAALRKVMDDADGRIAAVRLTLAGETHFAPTLFAKREEWEANIKVSAAEAGRGAIWIEKVVFDTREPALPSASGIGASTLGASAADGKATDERLFAAPLTTDADRALLEATAADLPKELRLEALDLATPAQQEAFLEDVRLTLRARLLRSPNESRDS